MSRRLRPLVVVLVLTLPGCAARSDVTVGQKLGTAGVTFYEAIGQAGKMTKALEQSDVIPTEDALRVQEALLEVNTAQQPFTDGLRRLDTIEQMTENERVKTLQIVVELTGMLSAQMETVFERLGDVPQGEEILAVLRAAREALETIRLGVQPWLERGVA